MASRGRTVAARAQRMIRAVASIAAATTKVASSTTAPVKKAARVRQKPAAPTKAPASKKAAASTKAAPAKKVAASTKAAPAKKVAASTKAAPAKKVATSTKKAAPKKAATPKKATASTTTKAAAKKTAPKKQVATKQAATKQAATTASSARSGSKATAATTSAPAARTAPTTTAASSKAASLRVREDESPWTPAELAQVRAALEGQVQRLGGEISQAESGLADLLRDSGDGAGDDQADAGAKTFEREQEISLANNSREMLLQSERALARIADGTYGVCESCGNPIGKLRLQVFPRATLCMTCKQRQERR
jgi:RNA polymerase-binding transcription factor DksA